MLQVLSEPTPNNSFKPTDGVGQLIKQPSRAGGGLIHVLVDMSKIIEPPPSELTSARVLAYAVIDDDVEYTGRISVYVDGVLLGPVLRLVIALNNYEPDDYLLLYCDSEWSVLGVGGYSSLVEAKERAEVAYAGVSTKWQDVA